MKWYIIVNFTFNHFVNYKNSEPLRPENSKNVTNSRDFFVCSNAIVWKGVIYYHIVAVPLKGALILSFVVTVYALNFTAPQYLGQI